MGVGLWCNLMICIGGHSMAQIPQFAKPRFPMCPLCDEPVELETTKTDEDGQTIHEECYVLKLSLKKATTH